MKRRREEEHLDDAKRNRPLVGSAIIKDTHDCVKRLNRHTSSFVATESHLFVSGDCRVDVLDIKSGRQTTSLEVNNKDDLWYLCYSPSRREIFTCSDRGGVRVFSSLHPFPLSREWLCVHKNGKRIDSVSAFLLNDQEGELIVSTLGIDPSDKIPEQLYVLNVHGTFVRTVKVAEALQSIHSEPFLINGDIWMIHEHTGAIVILDRETGTQKGGINGLWAEPESYLRVQQMGELAVVSLYTSNEGDSLHPKKTKLILFHVQTRQFLSETSPTWSTSIYGPQMSRTQHNQFMLTGRIGMQMFAIRQVFALTLLCGLHPRCGSNSVLRRVEQRCPVFTHQALRLALRLANVLFDLRDKNLT